MSFISATFLFALVAAAGPTVIHLLNRRRRRTIRWGPMDFLLQVIKRNRRILKLRDIVLLALRTLAVILFVLAMARPYWSGGAEGGAGKRPMHAVLVIDNSLSMSYTPLGDKSLLEEAKAKTREFIESLPSGSEISVIPLCTYSRWHARDIYTTPEDAVEAVNRIEVVDRSASVTEGLAQATKACRLASSIPTKRVVFIGDAQQGTWSLAGAKTYLDGISDIQIVRVGPPERTNTWVADFRLLNGIAGTDSTAVFRATIRHEGEPRKGVGVTLTIGGKEIESRNVDLVAGHEWRMDFHHRFDKSGSSAAPLFIPAKLALTPDDLKMDDSRVLIAPVVAQVPVIFVDQYGPGEQPAENMYGETARVRKLLSARAYGKPVLLTIDKLGRDDLKEARLVVIGGVVAPSPEAVSMLREYVEQGGNVFIGAGETFDPVQWTDRAWLDGAGILPAPLKSELIVADSPAGGKPAGFALDRSTIVGEALYLDTTTGDQRDRILALPRFFKAVVADVPAAREAISRVERKRIEKLREQSAQGKAASPHWLEWSNPLAPGAAMSSVDDLVNATQPRVLGQYDNKHPFVIERQIGKGRVILLTSGLWPAWNTMAQDNSVLLLDSIMGSLLVQSLPDRTFGPENQILVPVAAVDQGAIFTVLRPGDTEPLLQSVEAMAPDSYALLLRSVQRRGVYRIDCRRRTGKDEEQAPQDGAPDTGSEAGWAMMLAVNGPASESELATEAQTGRPDRIGETDVTWIGPKQEISLVGKTFVGHDLWQILMVLALVCILLEMALLAGWRLVGLPKGAAADNGSADQTAPVDAAL